MADNPEQLPVPMELFDDEQLPVKPKVVQLAKDGAYKHTGAKALEDEKLCARIVECITWKWGLKRISRELRVSKWTVIAVMDALVARGDLAPYKERMVRKMEIFLEGGLDRMIEGLHDGTLSTAQIPIGWGIVSDKRALALGEPTSIGVHGTATLDPDKLSVKTLTEFFASRDSQSTGKAPEPKQIKGSHTDDAGLDAAPAGPGPGQDPPTEAARGAGGSPGPGAAGGPSRSDQTTER